MATRPRIHLAGVLALLLASPAWGERQVPQPTRQRTTSLRRITPGPVVPRSQVPPVDEARLIRSVRSTWYQAHDDLRVTFRKEIMESAIARGERPRPELLGNVVVVPTPRRGTLRLRLVHPDGRAELLRPIEAEGPVTTFDLDVRLRPGRSTLQVIPEGRETPSQTLAIDR